MDSQSEAHEAEPSADTALAVTLPLIILAIGIAGLLVLVNTRAAPTREAIIQRPPIIEVALATLTTSPPQMVRHGTVQAPYRQQLVAEVGGRVLELSPNLVEGGAVSANEVLVRIEDLDLRSAEARAGAELARRQQLLAEERSRAAAAATEWNALRPNESAPPLALRQPQVASAEADIAAAEAALAQARRDRERAAVLAPIAGRVLRRLVEPGQMLQRGSLLAELLPDGRVEIPLAMPLALLAVIDPDGHGEVSISAVIGGERQHWRGRVDRSGAALDARERTLPLIISVDDPNSGDEPLRPGLFVEATFAGVVPPGTVELPIAALRGENEVWLVDEQRRLRRRQVQVLHRERERVLITSGLSEGDRVALTRLAGAVDGLEVAIAGENPAQPEAPVESTP